MPYPYTPPEFLENQTVEAIHRRMLGALPDDIDKSELGIPWDFTRPAAEEKAEFVGFELNETIKIIFPHWADGRWLDRHAEMEGLSRRPANRAFGTLEVTGRPGVTVAQGFQFATPANLTASVIFEATEEIVLDGEPDGTGQVAGVVPVRAVEGGRGGNVPPDSVILMVRPDAGITYITNPEATTGGAPEETDDELRERVLDMIRYGISWTGCDADYVRWAKEVPGVGQAVTQAEWAGPGTVRLFVIDANGLPANQQILDAVYVHIIHPEDRMQRKAPIGATLTVAAPEPLYVDIAATILLQEDENLDAVIDRFRGNLNNYWLEATSENSLFEIQSGAAQNFIKFVFVAATLANTLGVANYIPRSLLVNGGRDDIPISIGRFPVTREVVMIE